MKLTNVSSNSTTSVLVYGPPKTGKTQLVGELANYFNLHWFDIENGYETLLKLPNSAKDRVELYRIPDSKIYPIAVETLLKIIPGNQVEMCHEHSKIACALCKKEAKPLYIINLNALDAKKDIVVFDSLTQLVDSAVNHMSKNKPDDYKFDYADWANLGRVMSTFLSHIQASKFNVICISHETEAEMEDGKMKIVPTAGTRNFSRNTAKYFAHVIYADVRTGKHKFTSESVGIPNVVSGSRGDLSLSKMESPSLKSLFI
jgi:AAA domain